MRKEQPISADVDVSGRIVPIVNDLHVGRVIKQKNAIYIIV